MKKKEFSLILVSFLMLILHFADCDFFRVQNFRNRSRTRLKIESGASERIDQATRSRVKLSDQRRIDVKDNIFNNFRRYEPSRTTQRIKNTFRSLDDKNHENRRMNKENRRVIRISGLSRKTHEFEESNFRKLFPESRKSERDMRSTLKINRRIKSRNVDRIFDDRASQDSRISLLAKPQIQNSREDRRDMLHIIKNTLLRQTFRFVPNYGRETDRKTFRSNDPIFVSENRRKVQIASRNNLLSKRSSDLKRNSFEFQSRILAREIARERDGVMMKTKRELKILFETSNANGRSVSPENRIRNRNIAKRIPVSRYRRELNGVAEERVSERQSTRRHVLGKNSHLPSRMLQETRSFRVFGFGKWRRDLTLSPDSQNKLMMLKYSRKSGRISKSLTAVRASRMVEAIHSSDNIKTENHQIQESENTRKGKDKLKLDSSKNNFRAKNLRKTILSELSVERQSLRTEQSVIDLTRNKYSVRDSRLPTTIIRDVHRIVRYSRYVPNTEKYGLSERISHNTALKRLSTDILDSRNKNIRSRISEKELTNRQSVRNTRSNRDLVSSERIRSDIRSANRRFMNVVKHVISTSRNIDQRRQEVRKLRANSERSRRASERNYSPSLSRNTKDEYTFRKTSNPEENDARRIRIVSTKDRLRLSSRSSQTRDQSILSSSSKLETNRRIEQLHRSSALSRNSRTVRSTLDEITDTSRDVQRNIRSKMLPRASRLIRNNRLELSENIKVSSLRKSSDQADRVSITLSRDRNLHTLNSRIVEPLQTIKYSTTRALNIGKEQEDQKGSSIFKIITELFHHVINRDDKYVSFVFDALLGMAVLAILMDEPNKGIVSRFKSHFDHGFRIFQNWSIKI